MPQYTQQSYCLATSYAVLKENGNQPAEFNVNLITAFKVDVKVSQSYTNENGGKDGGKETHVGERNR